MKQKEETIVKTNKEKNKRNVRRENQNKRAESSRNH
jgi:hypothetical protein